MRIPFQFVKAMVIGGLFFLVPFALIIVAVEKLIVVLRPAASKAAALFNPLGIGPGWEIAIVVVTLLLTCLVAGLFGMTVAGRGLFGLMEATLLNRVPGYSIVKGAAADAAGNLSHIESTGLRSVYDGAGFSLQSRRCRSALTPFISTNTPRPPLSLGNIHVHLPETTHRG